MKIMRAALPLSPGRILSPETHWFSMENMLLPGTRTIMPQVIRAGASSDFREEIGKYSGGEGPEKDPSKGSDIVPAKCGKRKRDGQSENGPADFMKGNI